MSNIGDNNPAFCVLPWMHLAMTVDGVWGRCCFDASNDYDYYYGESEKPELALNPDALGCSPKSSYAPDNPDRVFGISEAFNSPNMRRTRLDMLAGQKPAACWLCYRQDDEGNRSHRQEVNDRYAKLPEIKDLVESTRPNGMIDRFPMSMDVRLGNTCGLACIMCSFPVSSRWGADQRPKWTTANIDPYREDDDFWAALRENANDLRYLYIAGGEPFQQPGHDRLLDLLIETDAAGRVALHYNSNLMVVPQGVFAKFAHFSSVAIAASCDGVGEVFEKIRVHGRWSTFVANLRTVRRHVEVFLDVSPQRDNVHDIGRLIQFARDEGVPIRLENYINYPEELSLRNLPLAAKEEHGTALDRLIEDCTAQSRDEVARQLRRLAAFMRLPPTIS